MTQWHLADQIRREAELFYRACFDVLEDAPGRADDYLKLLLFNVARDFFVSSPSVGAWASREWKQIPLEAASVNDQAGALFKDRVYWKSEVAILLLLCRLGRSLDCFNARPIEGDIYPVIAGYLAESLLGERSILSRDILERSYGPCDFRLALSLIADFDPSACASGRAMVQVCIDKLFAHSASADALMLVYDLLFDGSLSPADDESPLQWLQRVKEAYVNLTFQDGASSVGDGPGSGQVRRRQEAEFKHHPLKKTIIRAAIDRLIHSWREGVSQLDKQRFEQQLSTEFDSVRQGIIADLAYGRLITVSASMAYLAVGLYKKNKGWYADEAGVVWLDLTRATKLRPQRT